MSEQKLSDRMFPIQSCGTNMHEIPWSLIEPHEKQAQLNHGGQTLERLAQRGGLSPEEAVAVISDKGFRDFWPQMAADMLFGMIQPKPTCANCDTLAQQLADSRKECGEALQCLSEAIKFASSFRPVNNTHRNWYADSVKLLSKYQGKEGEK